MWYHGWPLEQFGGKADLLRHIQLFEYIHTRPIVLAERQCYVIVSCGLNYCTVSADLDTFNKTEGNMAEFFC